MIGSIISSFRLVELRYALWISIWLFALGSIPAVEGQTHSASWKSDRVSRLIDKLKDPSSTARESAAEELRDYHLHDPRVVEPLIAALKDTDRDVRLSAAVALGKIKDPRAVEPLIVALEDSDVNVRCSAIDALGELRDTRAVEPLIPALKDIELALSERAAIALGDIGDPRAVEPLLAALKDWTKEPDLRGSSAKALGDIKDPRAVEPLIVALGDKDKFVNEKAAEALGRIGSPAVKPLINKLKYTNSEYTLEVDIALSNIGAPAVDDLITALKDADPIVQWNAAYALSGIEDSRSKDAFQAFGERRIIEVARNYSSFIARGEPNRKRLIQA